MFHPSMGRAVAHRHHQYHHHHDIIDGSSCSFKSSRRVFDYRYRNNNGRKSFLGRLLVTSLTVAVILLITVLPYYTTLASTNTKNESSWCRTKKEWNSIWSKIRPSSCSSNSKNSAIVTRGGTSSSSDSSTNEAIPSTSTSRMTASSTITSTDVEAVITADDMNNTKVDDEEGITNDDDNNNNISSNNHHRSSNDPSQLQQQQSMDDTDTSLFSTSHIMSKKRIQFLDRIAILASSIMRKDTSSLDMLRPTSNDSGNNLLYKVNSINNNRVQEEYKLDDKTPQSDLTIPGRHVHIVTTAALPWFTGTAVNPLLRAAYLHRKLHQINTEQHSQQQQPNQTNITTTTTTTSSSNTTTTSDNATETMNVVNDTATAANTTTIKRWVTLVIPWLELPEDQMMLYNGRVFQNYQEQEQYIRNWLRNDADMDDAACYTTGIEILFYPGRYHPGLGSIFAMGDIIDTIVNSSIITTSTTPNSNSGENDTTDATIVGTSTNGIVSNLTEDITESSISTTIEQQQLMIQQQPQQPHTRPLDVCVLEEPEHCNWYRAPGNGWTKRFNYVIGIVHTNYKEYASAHYSGLWTAPAIALMSSAMIRAYCHKVIKLSNTLQSYAVEKETTSNVHGVRSNFWQEGLRRSKVPSSWQDSTTGDSTTSIYFIGKLLWAKGLDLMLELEDYYKQYTGDYFPIDIYGSGPDQRAITRAFHGRRNSVNADPKQEAEIEAMDKDDEDNNDEACDWDDGISSDSSVQATPNNDIDDRDDGAENNIFWSNSGSELYVKAKQKIAQLKATINTAVDLHEMTKEHIAKIKDTINNVEIPSTFAELRRQPIPASFKGRVDHGTLVQYRIFFNPSISEVLCTTTAEALAMGKYAIIPVHPSNTFFLQFPNCLAYRNKFEFVANLRWALTHDPEPLTEDQIHQFTWEAATERFIAASAITWKEALERERLGLAKLDERIAWFHNELGKGETGDFLRKVLGAGPASHQVKYQKEKWGDTTTSPVNKDGQQQEDDNDDVLDDGDDEEETSFSRKFRRSSFAQAIQAAIKDFASFGIQ